MTGKKFFINEAVEFGWHKMKENLGFFIGLILVVGLISIAMELVQNLVLKNIPLLSILFTIFSLFVHIVIGMGMIRIALRFCSGEKGSFGDFFSCLPLFFKYLGGSILYALIVIGGLILLIFPGVIWSIKFQYYSYLIIDQGLGPVEALKKSAAITRGAKWSLLGFNIVIGIINLLGAICLLIGLFATMPTTMVAMAFIYRLLLSRLETEEIPGIPDQEIISAK